MFSEHPVDSVVVLKHDVGGDGHPRPCGKIAAHATLGWLEGVIAGSTPLKCKSCHQMLTLDDTTGDEPYVPEYRAPRGH